MDNTAEKIFIIASHGAEDPERATFPFVVANAALAMDVKTAVLLQGGSVVKLAVPGANEQVLAAGLPPLKDLMDAFLEQGGELLICSPCIKEQGIAPEMLVKGAEVVAAARVVTECLEAKAVLNY